jgi:CarboxypepD_reg-like domain/TonB-dependent Receptor Plug Domain
MNRLITVLFFFLLLPGIVLAGTTGKLKGKVTDQQSGEPLIGANVLIVGTSFGAATDVNGRYTINNLEAGSYEVKISYIGYQAKTIANIRINSDLTTELNIELAPEGIEVGEVLVVAEKQLINKYNTNANRITTSDDIDALPVRGIDNILALTPGVVQQDNTLFIRGGRQDEVGYYLEGTSVTDPMVGGSRVTLVQEALEELQVQAGGYTAEFGGANSGIIRTQIKTGTPSWHFTAEYITDNMGFQGSGDRFSGKRTLGAYWFGYNEMIGTISGPLGTEKIKFFGLFDYNYQTDQNPQPFPGFNLGTIGDPTTGDTLNFFYPAGAVQGNSLENYTGTGSLTFDFNPFIVRLVGTYTSTSSLNPWAPARFAGVITNFLNVGRTQNQEGTDGSVNLKLTHLLNQDTYWEVNVGYAFNDFNSFDPLLKDNFLFQDANGWGGYGDSLTNANLAGVTWDRSRGGNIGRYERPKRFNIFTFTFNAPGDVVAGYQKFDRRNFNASLNFNTQINEHSIKFGGEYQYYDIRNYSWSNRSLMPLPGLLAANDALPDGDPQKVSPTTLLQRNGVNNFGYDAFGNRTNDGLPEWEQARNPVFLGIYVQDRFEFNDLIINAGLRYDYIDIDNWVPIDQSRPDLTWDKQTFDLITDDNGKVTGLTQTPSFSSVSPRLGFSFPVTDQTVFHAQWGKFVQQTRLRDVYQGVYATGNQIGGGFFIPAPVGFNVRPTRTTQYEVGFTQQIGDFVSFDITGFYKDIVDQVIFDQQTVVESEFGAYNYLTNGDFATTKGIEIAINMRRVERFLAYGNITFQDARGTGSFPNSSRGIVGAPLDGVTIFQPQYINPLEYNNAIRGNLNLDYRFGKGDGGPVFQEFGASLLFTFSSGHPYTRGKGGADLEGDARDRQPLESLNASTTPSIVQLDLRVDKTFNIADVLNLNVYLWVINLLDTRNVYNVFLRTGSPDDDGYLGDPNLGGVLANSLGPDYVALYNAVNLDYLEQWRVATTGAAYTTNPLMFGPPRQIRFGIRLEY